jgi:5-methyltetrahydrofolate corrinoid/iron sulfur protein methyltransferase
MLLFLTGCFKKGAQSQKEKVRSLVLRAIFRIAPCCQKGVAGMLVIGEKLSVIAKRVREAMMKKDKGPIQEIARAQQGAGAGMIDANIGPAEDNGEDLMQWMVTTIQEAVQLPVCLDTTNFKAVEAGLMVHNNEWGRPLINSTSNDPERFSMLELASKYHAQIIGLTVGKGGLPADAEERAAIAAEIMARAYEYGVPLEDIYLDPLVLQIATSQDHALKVVKSVKMFQELNDPPMKTVVGLSNISNGCPKHLRPVLNNHFLSLLMYEGLTAAIADAHEIMPTVKTIDAILGRTLYAHSYLEIS